MADNQQLYYRDGTSQVQRLMAALKENYVAIDERTIEDWLRFAQTYAKELQYYNLENKPSGDWSDFLNGEIEHILTYLKDPEAFKDQPNLEAWLSRPHFVLFLTFLKLLDQYQKPALNHILQKHLDYYYRDILQFKRKPATPDKVFLLAALAKSYKKPRFPLPKDTAAFAGKDATGKDLIYKTQEQLIVNKAKVVDLKSVFVHRKVDQFSDYDLPQYFMPMLQLALGQVEITDEESGETHFVLKPGAELEKPDFLEFEHIIHETFEPILAVLDFAQDRLHLSFTNLRKLMRLKQNRDADANEWASINHALGEMARNGPLSPTSTNDPKHFEQHFINATGYSPIEDVIYDDLQNTNNVYELYEELNFAVSGKLDHISLDEPENGYYDLQRLNILKSFINEKFYTSTDEEAVLNARTHAFHQMMYTRILIRKDWQEMRDVLANTPSLPNEVSINLELPNFAQLLENTYGNTPDFSLSHSTINDIDAYYETLIKIEKYFALPMEEVQILLRAVLQRGEAEIVYELLKKAHQNKQHIIRRAELSVVGRDLEALLKATLGRPNSGDNYPSLPSGIQDFDMLFERIETGDEAERKRASDYIQNQLHLTENNLRFILQVDADQQSAPDHQAPQWKWERVYRLLEEAERKLRGSFARTKPEVVRLNGLYAFSDAKEATTGNESETHPRWRTFGRVEADRLANLGFAIQSPILSLAEGKRIISIDIYAKDGLTQAQKSALGKINHEIDENGLPRHPFSIAVTGEKEWLIVETFDQIIFTPASDPDSSDKLYIKFTLSPDFDPIIALPEDAADTLGNAPAVRILVNRPGMIFQEETGDAVITGSQFTAHDLFSKFNIQEIDLHVTVSSLTPSSVRNDLAALKPEEIFEPFGSSPKPKANLYFTHPELAFKQLDSISLQLNWQGMPDWATHYKHYREGRTNGDTFVAKLYLSDQGNKRTFEDISTSSDIKLFADNVNELALTIVPDEQSIPYIPLEGPELPNDLFEAPRYFYLQLGTVDFGHSEYPGLATQKANELAIEIAKYAKGELIIDDDGNEVEMSAPNAADYLVQPPYTPLLQNFQVGYTVSANNLISAETDHKAEVLHIHPFGHKRLSLPHTHAILPPYGQEGYLYIGIEDLDPPFDLTLLFQMAEGSADPDITPPPLDWRYLSGDSWERIEQYGRIISDGTNGFLNSGIIKLRIPDRANTTHSQLPSGLYWLRVSVRMNSAGLTDVIGIHPHAVTAIFEDRANDPTHLEQPLAPESIKRTLPPYPQLQPLWQPYSSFGGHPIEPLTELNTRVSERLRHKDRALTLWDYERLVLEKFPQVYKAKCITGDLLDTQYAGKVVVIVVPNIIGIRPFDPFEPKLPLNMLREIQHFLKAHAPQQAQIVVQNPAYIQLRIRLSIELHPGYQADGKYYLEVMQQALLEYLAPWAFDKGADIAIGGKIFPSLIVDFVERQEYVDYVKDYRLFYTVEGEQRPASRTEMQEGIIAPRPDAIWVPDRTHFLSTTGASGIGIGYMIVENDFQVA